jgi:hypothetical protein
MPGGETQVAKRDAGVETAAANAAATTPRPAKPRGRADVKDAKSPGKTEQLAALPASQRETLALGGNVQPVMRDYWALAAKFAVVALGFGAVMLGARSVYRHRRRPTRLD